MTKTIISKRINAIKPSPTFAFDAYVKSLESSGVRIINFGLGEPDFNTPLKIKEAGIKAIKENFSHYTAIPGISELRNEIAKKFFKENSISYTPDQIIVGVGAKQLLYHAFQVLCNSSDEVLIATPTWSTYIEQVKLSGARPILISLSPPFKLKARYLIPYISKKTKVILLNSPSNPTGVIIDKAELIKIAKIVIENDLLVISDEIYEKLTYGVKNYSIASFDGEIRKRCITINGFSKSYAMTGWRVGYAAGPKEVIDAMILLQGQTTSATSSISQKAALGAFLGTKVEIRVMLKEYTKRRNYIIKELSEVKSIIVTSPEGAFYFFIGINKLLGSNGESSEDWCMKLLEDEKVAVIPGEAFEAPGFMRLSFTTNFEDIKEGIRRMKRFIKEN